MALENVRARLAKGTAWITASRILSNILSIISTLVLARILVPADFGLVALATTMLAVIASITDLSLGNALIQHSDPTHVHYNTAWTLGMLRGLIIAILFCLAAAPAAKIYHEPRLFLVMVSLAGGVFINGLSNPRATLLTKQLIFWQQFLLQVVEKIVVLVVSLAIGLVYRSYWALVWGALAGQLSHVVITFLVLPMRPRFSVRFSRQLLGFSIWLTLGQIANTINWRFDQLVIGGTLGRTALGFYTVGDNLAVIPTREATAPITSTLFPAFAGLASDRARLASAYQAAQALVTAIALPAGVGMALIAKPLVQLTMGAKWLPTVFLIQVLASVFAAQTLGTLSQPLAMATGQTGLLFKRDLQSFVIRIPFILGGLWLGGLSGIIWARALTGSIAIVLHMQVVRRITGLGYGQQLKVNGRSLVSVGLMALGVALVATQSEGLGGSVLGLIGQIAVLGGAGVVIYVTAHYGLWMIQGRPSGPETEIQGLVRTLAHRLGRPSPAG